jgi:hypothetical protein
MKSFVDESSANRSDDISTRATNSYIEVEFPIQKSLSSFLYIIPRNKSSVFIVTCWEHAFDELLENIDENGWETIVETWPTLAKLLYNGIKDRYQEGALILLEDFDYGENKWFVASICGNLDLDDIEELFNDRAQETMMLVLGKSMELLTELQENSPSMMRAIGKGFSKGVKMGIGAVALGALAALFGVDPDDLIS